MAADSDHRHYQSYCNNSNWSQSEMPSEAVSISGILDHGSISFGRFAMESLAWEKRSVFSRNGCQEELEKFKAPGFVAQKKAYFEEYYRRVRAMKALQLIQQQTNHPDSTINTTQEENAVDADLMKGQKKPINGSKMQNSEHEATANLNSSEGGRVEDSGKASMTGGTSKSLSAIEPEDFVKRACSSSVNGSSGTAKHDYPVSDTAKHDANKQKKQAPIQKAMATDSSRENETHLDCRIIKRPVKTSEKLKPSLHHNITSKRDDGLLSTKRIPQHAKVISPDYVSSHKQRAEVRSIATALHNSLARDMSVKSSISNGGQVKTNSTFKGLLEKLPTKLTLHARPTQGIKKEGTITDRLRQPILDSRRSCDARKPLEPSDRQMKPKRGASKNQRSNVRLTNRPIQSNLNQDHGVEFGHKNYVQGLLKKREDKRNAGLGKVFKSASANLSSTNNAPNPILVPKSQDAKLAMKVKVKGVWNYRSPLNL